jgi:hypothetical protein
MKVREGLIKYISPKTPKEQRMEAALCFAGEGKGVPVVGDGELEPNDQLTVLFVLCHDSDAEVAAAARSSLKACPLKFVLGALGDKLDAAVLKKLVKMHKENAAVLSLAALNEGADAPLLEALAETGPVEVVTILTEDSSILARYPSIAECIRKNPKATAAIIEALSPASPGADGEAPQEEAPQEEAPQEETPQEETPQEETPQEEASQEEAPQEEAPAAAAETELDPNDEEEVKKIEDMSVGQKIKLALTGDKTIRNMFITSSNKMISTAVMKNPRLTVEEVVKVANSKTTSDDIMRLIARNKEWTKNYNIRMAMIMNPKSPIQVALRMIDSLNIRDLEKVAKSRYISNVISGSADRMLVKKKR